MRNDGRPLGLLSAVVLSGLVLYLGIWAEQRHPPTDLAGGPGLAALGGRVVPSERVGPAAVPEGFEAMQVYDVVGSGSAHVVLLRTTGGESVLPIWIGASEALAIELRLAEQAPPRPLTHDLFQTVLTRMNASVAKMEIEALEDSVFRGRLYVDRGGERFSFDARPSDSIAMVLGAGAPIFVAHSVIREAGIDGKALLQAADDVALDEPAKGDRAAGNPAAEAAPADARPGAESGTGALSVGDAAPGDAEVPSERGEQHLRRGEPIDGLARDKSL